MTSNFGKEEYSAQAFSFHSKSLFQCAWTNCCSIQGKIEIAFKDITLIISSQICNHSPQLLFFSFLLHFQFFPLLSHFLFHDTGSELPPVLLLLVDVFFQSLLTTDLLLTPLGSQLRPLFSSSVLKSK